MSEIARTDLELYRIDMPEHGITVDIIVERDTVMPDSLLRAVREAIDLAAERGDLVRPSGDADWDGDDDFDCTCPLGAEDPVTTSEWCVVHAGWEMELGRAEDDAEDDEDNVILVAVTPEQLARANDLARHEFGFEFRGPVHEAKYIRTDLTSLDIDTHVVRLYAADQAWDLRGDDAQWAAVVIWGDGPFEGRK